jgi:hypothetical protein
MGRLLAAGEDEPRHDAKVVQRGGGFQNGGRSVNIPVKTGQVE